MLPLGRAHPSRPPGLIWGEIHSKFVILLIVLVFFLKKMVFKQKNPSDSGAECLTRGREGIKTNQLPTRRSTRMHRGDGWERKKRGDLGLLGWLRFFFR